MIQLTNVSPNLWAISTYYKGSKGVPLTLRLKSKTSGKNSYLRITKENLRNYGTGTQQEIADAVQLGLIQVNELDGVHVAPDTTPIPDGPFAPPPPPLATQAPPYTYTDEESLSEECIVYKNFYNGHVLNEGVHTAAGTNLITSPDPTTYAACYTLLGEAITDLNAHAPNAGVHVTADSANAVSLGAPATPAAARAKLKELWGVLASHMQFAFDGGKVLNPSDIIGYT